MPLGCSYSSVNMSCQWPTNFEQGCAIRVEEYGEFIQRLCTSSLNGSSSIPARGAIPHSHSHASEHPSCASTLSARSSSSCSIQLQSQGDTLEVELDVQERSSVS
mmetsp:Transcript_63357/g.169413  ORF Transcript_63357/g.169413 Transcript_63357/m.169413 type:complete len:105 (-) Transcript_63357:582-896(-)